MEIIDSKQQTIFGIYLVIDPSIEESILLDKLESALKERVITLQIWDNFKPGTSDKKLIQKILDLSLEAGIPLLINNRWELLTEFDLSGVHFDEIPENYEAIKASVGRPFICGITCTNDLNQVQWAADNELDYISFCSMFPSSSAANCEIVSFETVRKARQIFRKPIFLAGGIKPENLGQLDELRYDGIAVISGVLSAEDPGAAVNRYYQKLNN